MFVTSGTSTNDWCNRSKSGGIDGDMRGNHDGIPDYDKAITRSLLKTETTSCTALGICPCTLNYYLIFEKLISKICKPAKPVIMSATITETARPHVLLPPED